MFKKFVASFMTALMAAMVLVSPALGATALNTYPTLLGKVGDFYVVVGAKASSSDVAGAIDIAANLAQLSYKDTTVSGTTSSGLTGTERKIVIPTASPGVIAGSGSNNLPVTLKSFHYSGLKEGSFDYKGTSYNYHEEVVLNETASRFGLTHQSGDVVNGTLKARIDTLGLKYQYVFDSTISTNNFGPATSANTSTYQNPIKVTAAGREFQIIAIPATNSFKSLVGSVKTLSDGESMTVGDLTLKVVQSFATPTAKIEITDPSGNVVKSGINTGSQESFTYSGATWNYKVLDSRATASGVAGWGQVLFGKGDVEKTFENSDTSTVTEFGSDWKISGTFATAGQVTAGDKILVEYSPSSVNDDKRYFCPTSIATCAAGDTFKGPGGYFEVKYAGYTPDKFAKVTVAAITGQTVYDSTVATGYNSVTGLNGLKLTSDVAGTLVYSGTGYDDMVVLFNASVAAGNFNGTGHWLAYKDKATSKYVTVDNATYPVGKSSLHLGKLWNATPESNASWAISLSYGGPGAEIAFNLFGNSTGAGEAQQFNVTVSRGAAQVAYFAFQNKSIASTSTPPEFRLGATTGARDAGDVRANIDAVKNVDVSTAGTVITDQGVQIYTVKANVEGDKVVIGVPPETVYGLVQFGKIGTSTSTTGGTVKEVVAVTTAVAKLDSEVTSADKTGKELVLVGGPCVNTLVADLKTAGKFAYGCTDWPASNLGIVQVVDDAFATGKQAVVVAGTRAEDTRLASSVLQNYATKLSSITASKVEVTGAALATATVTAK